MKKSIFDLAKEYANKIEADEIIYFQNSGMKMSNIEDEEEEDIF